MAKRPLVLLSGFAVLVLACGGGGSSPAPTSGGTTPVATPAHSAAASVPASHAASPAATTATSPSASSQTTTGPSASASSEASMGAESPAASASAGASASPAAAACNATAGTPAAPGPSFDPSAISGTANLGHWNSSPAENAALDCALQGFAKTYPNVQVTNTTISDPYVTNMVTQFGAHNPPDVFYVNGDTVIDWATQGFLLPLDDYIAKSGFDMSKFFPGYQNTFQVNGKTYGVAKDGNTIAMEYNTDLVPTPPKTMDDLVTLATSLKGKTGPNGTPLTAPMCLNPGLDRGLAFLYAQGGSLLSDDNKTEQIDTDASKTAVQWYMDLFKNGLGVPAPSGSWCGEQLGKGNVAIVFEGGWLKGFMDTTYPGVHYAFSEMPVGTIGTPMTITYTAAYGIGADSKNPDQGWTAAQYLTGPDGMALWTNGGIAVPSRSDVPVPAGFEAIVAGAAYAKPGVPPVAHYNDIQKAFGDAFTQEITNQTYSADSVVTATAAAINTAVGGGH
jgi:multiple sugar transport system substrate-binding protein